MSLKQELKDMADALEDAVMKGLDGDPLRLRVIVVTHAAELRGFARALPDEPPGHDLRTYSPSIEDAKIRSRIAAQDAARRSRAEEACSLLVVDVEGGPAGGTSAPVPPDTLEGAYTSIAGAVYQYRGGKLVHSPREGKR